MSPLFFALSAGVVAAQYQLHMSAACARLTALAALVGVLVVLTSLAIQRTLPHRVLAAEWVLVATLFGFSVSAERAAQRLAERLAPDAGDQEVEARGWVADLPQGLPAGQRLLLALSPPEARSDDARSPVRPMRVSVVLPAKLGRGHPPVRGGDCRVWKLRLRPVHGTLNFSGFDSEAWMWSSGVAATGMVRALRPCLADPWRPGPALQALRDQLRARLHEQLGNRPGAAMVVALAVGDQSGVTQAQWDALWRSGVGHLVSISGVHVTLFASLLRFLAGRLWRCSAQACRFCPASSAAGVFGLAAALFYSLLAGYAIPTRRTLFMLGAAWLLTARGVLPGGGRVFWAAVATTLMSDPFAALSPSFWLSFGAVGGLVLADLGRFGPRAPWRGELHTQAVATLSLLPIAALCFGQLSLVSPLANALAIPLVSLVITPLTLAALFPGLGLLAVPAARLCEILLDGLAWLASPVWACRALAQPDSLAIGLASVSLGLLLAPYGGPGRMIAMLAFLPLLWPSSQAPLPGQAMVEVLDVGQGLCVLIRTADHAMLFDSGPRWPGGDAGTRTVIPLLRAEGISHLDILLLSHPDADHVGGADSLLAAFPVHLVAAGFARPGAIACSQGQSWRWDGVDFQMLYPDSRADAESSNASVRDHARTAARHDAHQRNNHACVLRVSAGGHAALLPADIEASAEQALLHNESVRSLLSSDLIVVAHHGSKTSSTAPWIEAVSPRLALISLGWHNRFHHPDDAVVTRWSDHGATVLRTDLSGGLRVLLSPEGVRLATARGARPAYWRASEQTAFPSRADNGVSRSNAP